MGSQVIDELLPATRVLPFQLDTVGLLSVLLGQHFPAHFFNLLCHAFQLGYKRIPPGGTGAGADDYQGSGHFRVSNAEIEGDIAAHGTAAYISFFNAEVP